MEILFLQGMGKNYMYALQDAHYREKSGKYQGIFSLFHNLKKITEMMLYMIKMATFFDENHLNYLYMSNFAIF